MADLFYSAPQNPYVFFALAMLTLISTFSSLVALLKSIVLFINNVIRNGVDISYKKISDNIHNHVKFIIASNNGSIYLICKTIDSLLFGVFCLMYFVLAVSFNSSPNDPIMYYSMSTGSPIHVSDIGFLVSMTMGLIMVTKFMHLFYICRKVRLIIMHDIAEIIKSNEK